MQQEVLLLLAALQGEGIVMGELFSLLLLLMLGFVACMILLMAAYFFLRR